MTSDEAETRRVQGVEEVRVSRGLSMDSERHTRRGPVGAGVENWQTPRIHFAGACLWHSLKHTYADPKQILAKK